MEASLGTGQLDKKPVPVVYAENISISTAFRLNAGEARGLGMENLPELRLALVCYGGGSLGGYMHGGTKKLQSLIWAARAFDKAVYDKASLENPDNPFRAGKPPYGAEAAYFDALKDLARRGRPVSVSIDIIGGTSAGGINGIALSKGLATGASQEPLKRV